MPALFSDSARPRPPRPETPRPASSFLDFDEPAPEADPTKRTGHRFDAELDICELDDRNRPGPTWPGQSLELSRSHITLRSRRMCYTGRPLLIAVHLIDDRPVPLAGTVRACSYDTEGMYRVEVDLVRVPTWPDVAAWLAQRRPR